MKTLGAIAAVVAVLMLAVASYQGIACPFIQNWGTQDDEATRALPGDDIVQPAVYQATRAIGIAAPASTVWAWVAQLGQDRGGFYSFTHLENLFGSEMPDVRTSQTRLLARDRTAAGMTASQALITRALMQPIHFVMEQRMLRGIKAMAEGRRISTAGNDVLTALWLLTGMLGIAAAIVALRGRRIWRGLAVLFGCALLFQVLTFIQPDPIVGAILLCALLLGLIPFRGLTSAPSAREPAIAGRVSSHSRLPRKRLLIACVGSVVVYGLGDLASGLLYHGYSYKDQWISELTAFGSPVRPLMVTAILTHGLLLLVFGVGLWRSADRRSLRRVGVLLMLAGVIGLPTHTVFAMSSRWMTAGFNDTMHALLSLTFSLIVFTAVVLSAVAFKGWFRLYSIATIPVLAGFGAASSVAIQGIAQNSTPWAGAFERVNAYAYFAWLLLLAVTVTRRSVDRGRRHSDVENDHRRSDRVGHIVQERRLRA